MRSTQSADRILGRLLHDVFPELVWRAVAQRLVRMHAVVMLEPRIELAQHAGRIGSRADPSVIPLEGFDEGFGHAVRLGTLDRVSCMAPGRCGAPERESPRRYRASRCPTAIRSVKSLLTSPKRRSTLSIIRSRMSALLMPPVVATQDIASRSQQ